MAINTMLSQNTTNFTKLEINFPLFQMPPNILRILTLLLRTTGVVDGASRSAYNKYANICPGV